MNVSRFIAIALVVVSCAFGAHRRAPLPTALAAAKTVYLENRGQDTTTFDSIYEKVSEWGKWQVVANRKDADVVLLFTDSNQIGYVAAASSGPGYSSSSVMPIMSMPRYLVIVDRETETS